MSWGYKIMILTLGFVGFMCFMVYSAMQQDFDLVAEDYYNKELKFQDQIEKQSNEQELKDSVICMVMADDIIIKFPNEHLGKKIKGEIQFFRPSDAGKDVKAVITSENGIQLLKRSLLTNGFYRVQIDYSVEGKKYYIEKPLMIQ